jgi:valyl-tRNA synthetase
MKGYNVHFPQGWDCHGLPTEVRAEKTHKIRKNDVPPAEFVKMCRELTDEYISKMKQTIIRLGISTDWKLEYRTMDPSYYKLTQLSFIRLYNKGHLYRGEHPVNWCPRCETAIAEAEVEHEERHGKLYHLQFGQDEQKLEVASTRPELLPACVALLVHPEDPRYKSIIGKKASVPIFNQMVSILADPDVDSSFGTGVVMVCTFGDKMDVKWQNKYKLPLIRAVTENGRLAVEDPRFKGLRTEEARKRIAELLISQGKISKTEQQTQSVGVCWRCKTPVEIISRPQWFMKTREMTEQVVGWAGKFRWVPEFARTRLIDWARSLDWDWVISRQRIFATPIPVWYCRDCARIVVPDEDQLPVDPRQDAPPVKKCPACGSSRLLGDSDVLDTWMDSSITTAVHAGWPKQDDWFSKLFPASLQPNGLDIIRTWDYYLIVRSLAMFGKPPYQTLLINGMVRGTDGRMMHKSYGNFVEAGEAMTRYGADPLRQWAAAGGSTGSDIPFRWTELDHGKKFLTKLWNVARFILTSTPEVPETREMEELPLIDKWLLVEVQDLVKQATMHFENFDFNLALETIRNFTWHTLADDYLEAVKYRLVPEAEANDKKNARFTLYATLLTICKLLAPICPHVTDAIYQQVPKTNTMPQSIHKTEWPSPETSRMDESAAKQGRALLEAISLSRRKKADSGISLKTPIRDLQIYTKPEQLAVLNDNKEVILRTLKAEKLTLAESQDLRVEISA